MMFSRKVNRANETEMCGFSSCSFRWLTLRFSGSPTQLNKEARSWRVRCKRLFGAVCHCPRHLSLVVPSRHGLCVWKFLDDQEILPSSSVCYGSILKTSPLPTEVPKLDT